MKKQKTFDQEMKPAPSVFRTILHGAAPTKDGVKGVQTKKKDFSSTPVESMFKSVLSTAMTHKPKITATEPKKAAKKQKSPKKQKTLNKKKETKKKPETQKKDTHYTSTAKAVVASDQEYQPGMFLNERSKWISQWIKNQEEKGLCFSRAYALKEWGTSLRKAQLLAHVPLPELKRRRFVGKEAETNPFLEMVEKAAPQDVD